MKKLTYIILGFYWYDRDKNSVLVFRYSFSGELEINKEGKISGIIEDENGEAEITGEIKDKFLIFKKRYKKDKRFPEERPEIKYKLVGNFHTEIEESFIGGWKGVWEIEDGTKGEASCVIFPK